MQTGYSSSAVVTALITSKGDIEEAADILLSSGPPTESDEMAAAFAGIDIDDDEWPNDVLNLNEPIQSVDVTSHLIDRLVHSFQGLDPGLAGFLLQQCDGDFKRTAKFIAEEVLGTTLPSSTMTKDKVEFM